MGVLNVTPDSFSDGGRFVDLDRAVAHGQEMIAAGADIIDVGGESSRPGAEPVIAEEELRRVLPVIEQLAAAWREPRPSGGTISIDTTKAVVAEACLAAGARIVNDISALRFDPAMADVVQGAGAGVVLMHMQGTPGTMQQQPRYADVVREVREFLAERLAWAEAREIDRRQIAVDPGLGFGKTVDHNLALLARLEGLQELGCALVVGSSRKSFIGRVLDRDVDQRLWGSAATVAWAAAHGARVVRVHDVAAMADVVRMIAAIQQWNS
ncbi:dihydropteroate synthase [bacterium]|nr:dihydropteroate synthase [bacterium]